MPQISAAEYAIRRESVAAGMQASGLDALCVFYPARVAYLTGFHHIPTERPIALVIGSSGQSSLIVPAVEKEHAETSTSVDQVRIYFEYPGAEHPMESVAAVHRVPASCQIDRRARLHPAQLRLGGACPSPDAGRNPDRQDRDGVLHAAGHRDSVRDGPRDARMAPARQRRSGTDRDVRRGPIDGHAPRFRQGTRYPAGRRPRQRSRGQHRRLPQRAGADDDHRRAHRGAGPGI
ncbi:MAG: hypothetical protein E6H99_14680 [Chloroflexi bacterium]|nr:MAG: hypothetical protein E6H99_14680 [Chloroflexota bacterium]